MAFSAYLRSLALLCLLPALLAAQAASPFRFQNVAAASGVDFVLDNSAREDKRYIESVPGGVAVFDYDNDGLPDLFFTNGAALPALDKRDARFHNRLYRNLGGMRFADVTAKANLAGEGFSFGAAVGDFDNDGHTDLFVAGYRANRLYRNRGDGSFEDITARAGIPSERWGVAAAFVDVNRDGLLDLFLVNYVQWDMDYSRFCGDRAKGVRVYCHPRYLKPEPNQLFRNNGDGTFTDISRESGIAAHAGKGMSVAVADVDLDGDPDLLVTNDSEPDFLFVNKGRGVFEEQGLLAGVAMSMSGRAVSSMGVDLRDVDNDGYPDAAVTALSGETFPFFRNQKDGSFQDQTHATGLAVETQRYAGWGIALADFDNDGWKDLLSANSHVNDRIADTEGGSYAQPNTLFRNEVGKRFRLQVDAGFSGSPAAHHGLAVADFDNDGLLDAAVSVVNGKAELWQNRRGGKSGGSNWIAFRLLGTKSNRSGIGARMEVDGQSNHQSASGSYAGSVLAPVHFGLGAAKLAKRVRITWPSGTVQELENLEAGKVHTVTEAPPR